MSNTFDWGKRPNRFLDPNARNELLRFKRDLVAQLFAQDGAFWEAVRKLRLEWRIEAVRLLPPPDLLGLFHPADLCRPPQEWGTREEWGESLEEYESLLEKYESLEEYRSQWKLFDDEDDLDKYQEWERDLEATARATIPQRFLVIDVSQDWSRFVAACALCDPPETELLEFADWGGPFSLDLPFHETDGDSTIASYLLGLSSGARTSSDPHKQLVADNRLLKHLVRELERRFLVPKGLVAVNVLYEIVAGKPEILMEALQDAAVVESPHCIPVHEMTTEDDVRREYRIIAAARKNSRKGAPHRDPLIALQCALLHDRHNEPVPGDRRRRKWTYKSLSKEFGLKGPWAAKIHIAEGREVLAGMQKRGVLPDENRGD